MLENLELFLSCRSGAEGLENETKHSSLITLTALTKHHAKVEVKELSKIMLCEASISLSIYDIFCIIYSFICAMNMIGTRQSVKCCFRFTAFLQQHLSHLLQSQSNATAAILKKALLMGESAITLGTKIGLLRWLCLINCFGFIIKQHEC